MSQNLQQILARIEDLETPVIWLDPSTPPALWEEAPGALQARGYRVALLDSEGSVGSYDALLDAFSKVFAFAAPHPRSLNALKDVLAGLPNTPQRGWVVLFRQPGVLRQEDEETFEDFLEMIDAVHEIKYSRHGLVFKLVVTD
jgi:RNAse (barnase) inhibitor barstar